MKPTDNWWVFTFGSGQEHAGKYVLIQGTFNEARTKMVERYGTKWAFQYSSKDWDDIVNNPCRTWPVETLLEVIE